MRHKDENCISNAWRSMVSVCAPLVFVGYVCVSVYYINYLTLSFLDRGVPSDIKEWSERFKPSSVISRPTENVCCTQEDPALQGQTRIKRWTLFHIMSPTQGLVRHKVTGSTCWTLNTFTCTIMHDRVVIKYWINMRISKCQKMFWPN